MSEHQYYEFRAVDRPLTKEQMLELRRYSSRAEITTTTFSVEYNWGDFKGDPRRWMEQYFDAFVHLANWGREDDLWSKADQLIVTKQPRKYDEAVSILQDLRDLAEKDQANSGFYQRMKSLSRDHANKPTLLRRIQKAGLSSHGIHL